MLAEVAADLRTAVATEHLTIATWALVGLGSATLVAACVAAVVAVRAYVLEATPTLFVGARESGLPSDGPLERGYRITCDRSGSKPASLTGFGPGPPLVAMLMIDDPRNAEKSRQIALEIKNLGRIAVAGASVTLRFVVPEISGFDDTSLQTRRRTFEADVAVGAIGPGSAVVLPLVNDVGAFEMSAVRVMAIRPGRAGKAKRNRSLPFASGTMFVWPP
jgi:hypothetical protein